MSTHVYSTLICILLLFVTEAVSVEQNEVDDLTYQEEAFPEETVEDELVTEGEIVNTDKRTGEVSAADISAEEQTEEEARQEADTLELQGKDEELYSGEAFPEEGIDDESIKEEESIYAVLDKPHEYVSEKVEWLITSVDRYFANDALYKYTTDSYLQLYGDVLFEETGEIGFGANLRTRVDLPGTERRFKLLIETDPTERQDPLERSVSDSPAAAVEESDVFAGIQRVKILRGWKVRPSIGARFTLPIEPYAKLRFTNIYPLQRWQLRADQNFYWFDDSGFGSDSTIEFDLPVGNEHLFRTTSFGRWTEETNYFEVSQTFTFFHTLSPNHRMSYQAGVYGQTSPTWFMTDYLLVVRYRQNLHKEWLFFEIQPRVQFSKINDWDDEASLLLRLDLLFGKKYL